METVVSPIAARADGRRGGGGGARATKRPRTTPTPMASPRAHVFPGPQRGAKRAFTAAFFRLGMGKFKFVISETRSRV